MKPRHLLTGIVAAFAFTIAAQAQEHGGGGIEPAIFEQKVIRLTHVDAMDTAAMLQGFLSIGKVAADQHTNAIVLSAPRDEIAMAERVIAELDTPASEKTAESSTVIRLGDSAPPDILDLVRTLVSRSTRAALDRETGTLVLRGPGGDINQVRELIAQLPEQPSAGHRDRLAVSFFFIQALLVPADRPDVELQDKRLYTPDPRNAAVTEKLDKRVPVNVNRAPLGDVLHQLGEAADVDIVVNWPSLEASGIGPDQLITLALREPAPLRSVLALVFEQLGAQDEFNFGVRHGIVRVAAREFLDQDTYIEVYNVHELVKAVPRFALEAMSSSAAPRAPGLGGFGGGTAMPFSGGDSEAQPPSPAPGIQHVAPIMWDERDDEPAEQLMEIIRNTVTPDDWHENGGTVASMHHADGMLVVKHNSRGHEAIVALLDLLRNRHAETRRAVGQIDVPPALRPVIDALAEQGFHNAMLLAPLRVTVGRSGRFELEGSAAQFDRMLDVRVEGEARSVDDDSVELRVKATIGPKVALPGTLAGPEPMFRLVSTMTTALGDYVVLATSPGATEYGQAIALVVRVDAAD